MAALPVQQQTALRVPLTAPATVPAPLASPDLSSRPAASAATSNAGKRTVPIIDVTYCEMRVNLNRDFALLTVVHATCAPSIVVAQRLDAVQQHTTSGFQYP